MIVLAGSSTWASILHLPTLSSLWQTSYGQAIMVKVALLIAAIVLAAINLLRTKPGLQAEDRERRRCRAAAAARRRRGRDRRRGGAVAAVTLVSSPAVEGARRGRWLDEAGGAWSGRLDHREERLPRRGPRRSEPRGRPNDFSLKLTRGGRPVRGAIVTVRFDMLDMAMGEQAYRMQETSPGLCTRAATPALVMVGHWGLSFDVAPKGSLRSTFRLSTTPPDEHEPPPARCARRTRRGIAAVIVAVELVRSVFA